MKKVKKLSVSNVGLARKVLSNASRHNTIDRKQTSRERQVSASKAAILEAMITSAGDHIIAVVVVDKIGKIIRVNQAFEALTDWKEKEVIGESLMKVIPREDEKGNRVPFKERVLSKVLLGKIFTTTTRTIANIEKMPTFYYIRKDKSRFPVDSVISPIILNGKIVGAIEIFHDITKEKEMDKIRMDFLSLASHQLRTPLSGTKWLIETMYRGVVGKMTKEQKEYLNDIYKINEQMIGLVFDILSTLRLESEKALIKKESVSVSSLLGMS